MCDHKISEPKDIDGADKPPKKKERKLKEYHINSSSSNSSDKVQTSLDKETLNNNKQGKTSSNSSDKVQTSLDKETLNNNKQGEKVLVIPSKKAQARRQRLSNCGKCVNCCKEDCGKCVSCKDKPKFGGNNTRKQRCVERICFNKVKNILYYMTRFAFLVY